MTKYNIQPHQIVYLHAPQRLYCKEKGELIKRFIETYSRAFSRECIVFRDSGTAFKDVETQLSPTDFNGKFIEYPSCVHELLSPNDNNAHGRAKRRWRTSDVYRKDDVSSSLFLLNELGTTDPKAVRNDFRRNFVRDGCKGPLVQHCRSLCAGLTSISDREIRDNEKSKRFYLDFMAGKNKRSATLKSVPPLALGSGLDGCQWNTFAQ